MPPLVHKVSAKACAARLLGAGWTIPTLWAGTRLPADHDWPYPFILKASHGCNQTIVCHDPADWDEARGAATRWLCKPYGLWLDEWAYRGIPRGFIVEPYLGDGERLPTDYKIYVFGGWASFVQVHTGRASRHRWILYDRDWRQVSMLGQTPTPAPTALKAMLQAAETMARPFDFARVDFYEIGGAAKFGEITFYPGSGLDPFDPPKLDLQLGALWLASSGQSLADSGQSGGWPAEALLQPTH